MRYITISLLSLFLLTSCAYTLERSVQSLTVETPGAEDAVCYVYVKGLRYRFKPPQSININKSKEDLIVDCYAPGNRHRKVVIEPSTSKVAYQNVFTGILPGMAWDSASGALYTYPDVVYVDFTNMKISPEDLPAQNNPDIKQPEEYDLEEFRHKQPRLNSDKYNLPVEIRERQPQQPLFSEPAAQDVAPVPQIKPVSLEDLDDDVSESDILEWGK